MSLLRFAAPLAALALAACGGDAATPPQTPDQPAASGAAGAASGAPAATPAAEPDNGIKAASSAEPVASAPPPPRDPKDNAILGKLSEADVQAQIQKHAADFDPCLPKAYKAKSSTIKVQLRPTIGPSGKVNEVKIQKTSGDAKFDACVAEAFKKIQFPPSRESAFVSPTWVELGGGMLESQ